MLMTPAQRKGAVLAAAEELRRHPEWWVAHSIEGAESARRDLYDHLAGAVPGRGFVHTSERLERAGFTDVERTCVFKCSAPAITASQMHANAVKLCERLWPGVEPEYPPIAYERGLVPWSTLVLDGSAFNRMSSKLVQTKCSGSSATTVASQDLRAIVRFASALQCYAAQCESHPHVMRAHRDLFEVKP